MLHTELGPRPPNMRLVPGAVYNEVAFRRSSSLPISIRFTSMPNCLWGTGCVTRAGLVCLRI